MGWTSHFSAQLETVAFGVPVHLVSGPDPITLIPLEEYLSTGETITMIGSSDAGKSTLVNRLCGKALQSQYGERNAHDDQPGAAGGNRTGELQENSRASYLKMKKEGGKSNLLNQYRRDCFGFRDS